MFATAVFIEYTDETLLLPYTWKDRSNGTQTFAAMLLVIMENY
jgi:hypothetical protein